MTWLSEEADMGQASLPFPLYISHTAIILIAIAQYHLVLVFHFFLHSDRTEKQVLLR